MVVLGFGFRVLERCSAAVFGVSGRHSPSCGRKSAADEIEIGEREQGEHLRAVLPDTAIADLAIAEPALQHAKDVLDLGAHLAEATVPGTLTLCEIAARLRFSFTPHSTPAASAARFFSSLA